MKIIKNIKTKSIYRFEDDKAMEFVKTGKYIYVPKMLWIQQNEKKITKMSTNKGDVKNKIICSNCGKKMKLNESKTKYVCKCGHTTKINILLG